MDSSTKDTKKGILLKLRTGSKDPRVFVLHFLGLLRALRDLRGENNVPQNIFRTS